MEKGFFHPDVGYWQAVGDLTDTFSENYPQGTVEIPLKPGQDYEWSGREWVLLPRPEFNPRTHALVKRPNADGLLPAWERKPLPIEQAASSMRAERAARLAESDWTQMPDSPLTAEQREQWASYRQALRDVPSQPGFPYEIEWPVKPV